MTLLFAVLVAAALLLAAFDVLAQAGDKGPFDLGQIGTYAWVVTISMLGGAAQFYRNVKAGRARPFNLAEFVGELLISGFAGFITYLLCKAGNVNPYITAAFVGIAGHMGSRAIFMGEQLLEKAASRFFGVTITLPPPAPIQPQTGAPGDQR